MREIEKNKISTDEADYANESDIVGDLALEQNDVTSTRVRPTNGKLAMWIFLSSDFLFFGGFISAYLLYRGRYSIYICNFIYFVDEFVNDGFIFSSYKKRGH